MVDFGMVRTGLAVCHCSVPLCLHGSASMQRKHVSGRPWLLCPVLFGCVSFPTSTGVVVFPRGLLLLLGLERLLIKTIIMSFYVLLPWFAVLAYLLMLWPACCWCVPAMSSRDDIRFCEFWHWVLHSCFYVHSFPHGFRFSCWHFVLRI